MNKIKLQFAISEKLFSDLTLILSDSSQDINVDVHKIILYASCPYFEKLLTNCKEKNSNIIPIEVHNSFVAYDTIMGFYNQVTNLGELDKWNQVLESIICKDYFNLDIKFNEFYMLDIPLKGKNEQDFNLLLKAIKIIGLNDDAIDILVKNIPDDYDLSKFDKNLIQKIYDNKSYQLLLVSWDMIKTFDVTNGKLLNSFHIIEEITCMSITNDFKKIYTGNKLGEINIFNPINGSLLNQLNRHGVIYDESKWFSYYMTEINLIKVSKDNKIIVSASVNIKIWDNQNECLINELVTSKNHCIFNICISDDNSKIFSSGESELITIWDANNCSIINQIKHGGMLMSLCLSRNNNLLISAVDNFIKIWDSNTQNLVKVFGQHNEKFDDICISDDETIIVANSRTQIIVYDFQTGEIKQQICKKKQNYHKRIHIIIKSNQIICIDEDSIHFYNIETGKFIKELYIGHMEQFCVQKILNEKLMEKIKHLIF